MSYHCYSCDTIHPDEYVCPKIKFVDEREHRELIHNLLQKYIKPGQRMDGSFYPAGSDDFIDAYLREMKNVGHA